MSAYIATNYTYAVLSEHVWGRSVVSIMACKTTHERWLLLNAYGKVGCTGLVSGQVENSYKPVRYTTAEHEASQFSLSTFHNVHAFDPVRCTRSSL
jgi:hypothetical protein